MNSTKNRTHSPWIFRPRQLPPEPCWDNLHGSVLFLLSILFHSIPPALKLLPHSSLPGLVFQHCSSLITNPWQIENSVFKPCLNPHAAQAKSNKQWIVKSHNMWHRWTCFLKETKLLALKRLETIIGKHLCLVSSKMVRPQLSFIWAVFFFPTSDGSGAGTQEERVYLVTFKYANKLLGSLPSAPAALRWLLYQKQTAHSCLLLGSHWVVRQTLVGWVFRKLPQSHTLPSKPKNYLGLRGNFEMSSFFTSKSLDCLFNVHLMLGIYLLIVLKISRSE